VGCAPGIASASTALIMGGAGRYADLTDEELADALGGYFADYDSRVNVSFAGTDDFGESIDAAADSMYDAVYSTPGKKTIGGVSQTAPAIAEVLRRLENDPDAPSPDELDAAMYGAPSPFFYRLSGVEYQPLPETPYNLLVVTAEYDGVADFPDNPFNLLAVVNAYMGYNQLHYQAAFSDISQVPEEYITTKTNSKGGTTTTILIPTRVLPLLKPLSDWGVSDDTVAYLDKILRPLVDSAYDRHREAAESEASESNLRSVSLVADEDTEDADQDDEATDTQSLSHDTEVKADADKPEDKPEAENSADADDKAEVKKADTEAPSEGRHAKKDAVEDDAPRGKHAKKDSVEDDKKDDAPRGKHAKDDKDGKSSADKSGGENAGASDAAA
jgi:hypothetical protein